MVTGEFGGSIRAEASYETAEGTLMADRRHAHQWHDANNHK